MGFIRVILIPLMFLSIFSFSIVLCQEEIAYIELKHDDGIPEGFSKSNHYLTINFSPPKTPFIIDYLKIYGRKYENTDGKVQIYIYSGNNTKIAEINISSEKFGREGGWATIEIPPVLVEGDFYISLYQIGDGIYIAYDTSGANKHWMIRVYGYVPKPFKMFVDKVEEGYEIHYDSEPITEDCIKLCGTESYLVRFTPPEIPWVIKKVRFYGARFGPPEKRYYIVWIADKNLKKIHKAESWGSYEELSLHPEWHEIEIKNITVYDDFYVDFWPNTNENGSVGMYVCFDKFRLSNGTSMISLDGEAGWKKSCASQDIVNFRIRVVGEKLTSPTTEKPKPSDEKKTGFSYGYVLALASIIGALALLGFKIKETVKRNLTYFASLIAGGRKEYLALLAIGVSLTYLIDYTWLQLAIKVSDKGFSSSPLGLILALLWGFLFIWLTYHVIAFFHFYLNLNFLGFIPISLVTIITASMIYPFSKKLKWLKFFVPILISTVLVYMIPASLLKEYLNRSDLDLIFVYLVGIVWAVRAALVTHFVEFIFKKLGSRK
ncbi:MAG: hypothetical protein DRN88_01460 [Candidatus Hydrothermarchaeota archaeon]|nr:MAG: hypothetical protein DRN88_01460 [Candidatus Hydrothermarchaeota archaeon]